MNLTNINETENREPSEIAARSDFRNMSRLVVAGDKPITTGSEGGTQSGE